jgi:hypothetical protein
MAASDSSRVLGTNVPLNFVMRSRMVFASWK